MIPLGDGFYVFKFSQLYGAKEVLEGGPWIIAGRYLVLRWWSAGLSLTKDSLSSIPVWVQFSGIPLEYWSAEGLSHIASAVGVPLYADAQTEQGTRLKFARICVEVDASKSLVEEIFLRSNTKGTLCPSHLIRIKALYQWKPKQCSLCQVFGHSDQACPKQVVIPINKAPRPDQIAGSSSDVAGKNQTSSMPAIVWRIASKKGKSRVMTEQEGLLPTLLGIIVGSSNPLAPSQVEKDIVANSEPDASSNQLGMSSQILPIEQPQLVVGDTPSDRPLPNTHEVCHGDPSKAGIQASEDKASVGESRNRGPFEDNTTQPDKCLQLLAANQTERASFSSVSAANTLDIVLESLALIGTIGAEVPVSLKSGLEAPSEISSLAPVLQRSTSPPSSQPIGIPLLSRPTSLLSSNMQTFLSSRSPIDSPSPVPSKLASKVRFIDGSISKVPLLSDRTAYPDLSSNSGK